MPVQTSYKYGPNLALQYLPVACDLAIRSLDLILSCRCRLCAIHIVSIAAASDLVIAWDVAAWGNLSVWAVFG